jgi:hypothetical protein
MHTILSDESDCVTEPWGQPFPDEDASIMVISVGSSPVADWQERVALRDWQLLLGQEGKLQLGIT